jgi:toxin HigB-1
MDFDFADDDLKRLYVDLGFTAGHSQTIVKAFRKRMQQVRAATDERVFYQLKSLHFEKLKGKRSHQHSMRLNGQFRLIVELVNSKSGKVIRIISIEDYH